MLFKRGQITVFIIIGILVVGTIAAFLALRGSFVENRIPATIQPVYHSFLSCLEDYTLSGANVLQIQGGYIQMPEFEPGSSYMPFSSQLDLLGNPIPYWYYVSGNNIPKEQVPTIPSMQNELNDFIGMKIKDCYLDNYYAQGFEIDFGEPKAKTAIKDGAIFVDLEMPMNITKDEDSILIQSYSVKVPSNLKKLYDSAIEIYSKEQKEMFLENYTVDILRNYAPVDGIELTCSPLTWNADKVFSELHSGIEANILALRTEGGDFSLKKQENKYFVIDTDINARFLTSKNWTYSFEVNPSNGVLLISEPMGDQQGMGILGFCYVAYHFVYDVKYPVLIQVYEGNDFFQFPFAVVIKGNVPREPMSGEFFEVEAPLEICNYKNTLTKISVTDKRANPIDAEISYKCSDALCDIGKTSEGELEALFPQCVNGNLIVHSSGFKELSVSYTILKESEVSVFLEKLYEKEINLKMNSKPHAGQAIISFLSDDETKTIVYPMQKKINLSEGEYQIMVSVYENSSITLPSSNQKQCIEVPKEGFGNLLGLTEEKCFDYSIPSQIVSNALSGGGKENYYVLESELENSKVIEINVESLPKPTSIEQLQNNYFLLENKGLEVLFK